MLAIVNGSILLWNYLRVKPILIVEPIHPDTHQWFFKLPNGVHQNKKTRKYGILTYISISNKGLRDVSVNSWRLQIKIQKKSKEFKPMNIPEPQYQLGTENLKIFPVLGQKGSQFQGHTMVKSGDSISGFAYYQPEFYGDWNLPVKENKLMGKILIKSVFGNKSTTNIQFKKISIEKAKKMIPDIDKIGT